MSRDQQYDVTRFVYDCYDREFRRDGFEKADREGLNQFTSWILDRTYTQQDIMVTLALSLKAQGNTQKNEDYIRMLYRLMLGREAYPGEVTMQVQELQIGITREEMAYRIVTSDECNEYLQECYPLNLQP